MKGSDDGGDGGEVVRFPRMFLPGSFDAPDTPPDDGVRDAPIPGMADLPTMDDMAPPLALTMPGIPKADAASDAQADEEGAFVPPAPEDPANPTPGEVVAVALAVVTAMGVAGANGMWHRARRRAALADEARAAADRSLAKAAGAKQGATKTASPTGSGGGGGKTGGRKRRGGSGHESGGSHTGPGRGGSPKGPKARRDGRTPRRKDRDEPRRRKDRPGWRKRRDDDAHGRKRKRPDTKPPKAPETPKPKSSKPPKGGTEKPRWMRPKRKDGKGWTFRPSKNRAKREKTKPPKRDRMTWTAPERKPGPGQDKAIAGRRRWRGRGTKPGKNRTRFSLPRFRKRTWKATRRWMKGYRMRRRAAAAGIRTSWRRAVWTAFKHRTGRWHAAGRSWGARRTQASAHGSSGAYPPPPGWEGMRPPRGADRTVRVENVERVDTPGRRADQPGHERPALLTDVGGGPSAPPPPATPRPTRRASAVTSVPNTQYNDAEITIYDLIDADMDMANEIGDGTVEALAAADGCEQLMTRLEAVHAKVVELGVPGLLAGWLLRLMEKTSMVRASAVAIATELPAAAEAIQVAGANAGARHQPMADVTRDMGHTRPAAAGYHDE